MMKIVLIAVIALAVWIPAWILFSWGEKTFKKKVDSPTEQAKELEKMLASLKQDIDEKTKQAEEMIAELNEIKKRM